MSLDAQIVLGIIAYLVLWEFGVLSTPDNGQVVRLAKHFRYPDACVEILSANKRVKVSDLIFGIFSSVDQSLTSQNLELARVGVIYCSGRSSAWVP